MYSNYSSYPSTTYATNSLESVLAALGSFLVVFLIIVIAIAVLTIVGQWKLFKKAGKEGYISLIPIYNVIAEMQLSGMPICWYFLNYCAFIPVVGWILPLVFQFWKNIKLAKAFGKGIGTGVLLSFFPFVMYPVLGFGTAQYVGTQSQAN